MTSQSTHPVYSVVQLLGRDDNVDHLLWVQTDLRDFTVVCVGCRSKPSVCPSIGEFARLKLPVFLLLELPCVQVLIGGLAVGGDFGGDLDGLGTLVLLDVVGTAVNTGRADVLWVGAELDDGLEAGTPGHHDLIVILHP